MTTTAAPKAKQEALTLKGGVFTLTTVVLHTTEIDVLEQWLVDKIKIAPKFFHNAPIVIDCSNFDQSSGVDFKAINKMFRKHLLIPVGIRGVKAELHQEAIKNSLAIMPESRHAREKLIQLTEQSQEKTEDVKTKPAAQIQQDDDVSGSATKVITQPVRSGQQIYAPGGDLLVLAPVSHGAELLADGNIYVFGAMRGRALAGITGDQSAMIFCKSLEAELVSLAGQYKISEDLKETWWKQSVRIYLQDGRLQFTEF